MQTYEQTNKQTNTKITWSVFFYGQTHCSICQSQLNGHCILPPGSPVSQCHRFLKKGSKGSALGYRPKQPSQNRSGSNLIPNDPRSVSTLIQSGLTDTLSTSDLIMWPLSVFSDIAASRFHV